jgi:hypothetical protein
MPKSYEIELPPSGAHPVSFRISFHSKDCGMNKPDMSVSRMESLTLSLESASLRAHLVKEADRSEYGRIVAEVEDIVRQMQEALASEKWTTGARVTSVEMH